MSFTRRRFLHGAGAALALPWLESIPVRAADTVLVTVPNQLGVDFNARLLAAVEDVFREVDAAPVPA